MHVVVELYVVVIELLAVFSVCRSNTHTDLYSVSVLVHIVCSPELHVLSIG